MPMDGNASDNDSDSDSLPGGGVGPATRSPSRTAPVAALTPEQRQEHENEQANEHEQLMAAEDMIATAMENATNANANGRRRDPTGDQALMGATNNDDGNVEGLEATDENGELVRQEFTKFLQQ